LDLAALAVDHHKPNRDQARLVSIALNVAKKRPIFWFD